ncbi:TlpA family protein disulfide reductase [Aureibacter tunicatorum]|uniref:Thiol-disulfide isomerase/thioredoxin n=1 Tax=Aureibacter tunicatorum TaxID=866807 RepID=A0AAE3XNN2_9BACT|nr:TlpA disulfide reductase family protein [Aureibacter tunicatorum]MDR6241251.1 thiol-disulfide isomerase/thioredoxin [Aureibacter tunicatorum]BDD03511.1 hypothetical protein AUTU_09940 [Aureibacter tunicatorum]
MKISKTQRTIIELLAIGAIILTLKLTGKLPEVIGFAQNLVLKTGLVRPSTKIDDNEKGLADLNFKLIDMEGNIHNASDFSGKTLFINFWATWCPPCIAEMPEIQSLYNGIDKNKVAFIMISMDENEEKLRKFIAKKNYTMPVYRLASPITSTFEFQSIPTTFIISPSDKIISKEVGIRSYNTKSFKEFLEDN